jgi:AcrR family transcriptional regulator
MSSSDLRRLVTTVTSGIKSADDSGGKLPGMDTAVHPQPVAPFADRPGLRERKKQHTREALVGAAFELFARKGFEATTVEEIAGSVMVSARTFFRYFTSKDDVVLRVVDEQWTAIFAAFEARPAGEPVLTAIRKAMVEALRACEAGQTELPPERFASVVRLLSKSPSLAARNLEQCTERMDELADKVATRMGVDPATDPRPKLVAAVIMSTIQTTVEAWRDDEPDALPSVLVERAVTLLEAGINYPAACAADNR